MTIDEITVRQTCPLGCWVVTGIGPPNPSTGQPCPIHCRTEEQARARAAAFVLAHWGEAA